MRVVVKGAPEYVLPMCVSVLDQNGKVMVIDSFESDRILKQEIIGSYATKGLKTIAYAYKDISYDEWESLKERHNNFEGHDDRHHLEQNLTFLAAFGMNDDLRPNVDEVIFKLEQGEVHVRMISGDNLETAKYAAKAAGILTT